MEPLDLDKVLIDNYFGLVKNLSPKLKWGLIKRITKTLNKDLSRDHFAFKSAFGSWDSIKSADNIILELRESRGFYRNIDSFE